MLFCEQVKHGVMERHNREWAVWEPKRDLSHRIFNMSLAMSIAGILMTWSDLIGWTVIPGAVHNTLTFFGLGLIAGVARYYYQPAYRRIQACQRWCAKIMSWSALTEGQPVWMKGPLG